MKYSEIQVGKKYRVRRWEDMADEFGEPDELLGIDMPAAYFMHKMRPLCGMTFTVSSASYIYHGDVYLRSVEGVEKLNRLPSMLGDEWFITPDMLEPFDEPGLEEIPSESIVDFLFG